MEIWDAGSGDIILLGSNRPWDWSLEGLRKACERELVRQDLAGIGLGTPEALFARQFASQRTAFAIAGPGPIQSDGFPVLEYEAPLAFYIGANASRLMRFDERTWQSGFASPEKRAALANLDNHTLARIFANCSINPELQRTITDRLQHPATGASRHSHNSNDSGRSPSPWGRGLGEGGIGVSPFFGGSARMRPPATPVTRSVSQGDWASKFPANELELAYVQRVVARETSRWTNVSLRIVAD
jgi:hypothetical protein